MSHFFNHFCGILLYYNFLQCNNADVMNEIGRVYIPDIGFPGAENVAVASDANRIFAADGFSIGLTVISFNFADDDFSDGNMAFEQTILFESIFEDFNISNLTALDVPSVNYSPSKDFIIANIVPTNYAIEYGWLAFIDPYDLSIFNFIQLTDCFLPDHVTTTNGGNTIVISCEGEPDDNTIEFPEYNPPGSVALVDVTSTNMEEWIVTNIGFTDFDEGGTKQDLLPNDVYIPYKNESFSINVEPEYGTCSSDSTYCYICLQEQNAIAILDMELREFVSIFTLGTNDYSVYGLDASDGDDAINIVTYPNLYGLRMPDAIDYFKSGGNREYIFTANEGDSKDFDESRIGSLSLDSGSFSDVDIDELQKNENLGRLKVTNLWGNEEDNGEYQELYAFSSRDFTIWEIIDEGGPMGSFVYSSNNEFEQITADVVGMDGFNCNDYVPSFDTRSDDKGPEPESIATGTCSNGRSYVFIGMERVNGIFVYDITNIDNGDVKYVEYINNRDFSVRYNQSTRAPEEAGDVGPEQLRFINENVFGVPLLIVANAESSSVTMYRIDCEEISSDEELTTLEIVGIVVGSVLIGVLLIVLCVYFIKIKRGKAEFRRVPSKTYSTISQNFDNCSD